MGNNATARTNSKLSTVKLRDALIDSFHVGQPSSLIESVEIESRSVLMGDVLVIRNDGIRIEYELKTLESDLQKELLMVETVIDCRDAGSSRYQRVKELRYPWMTERDDGLLINRYCLAAGTSKYKKHELYLSSTKSDKKPNLFYFVVSREILTYAAHRLARLPYGLIAVDLETGEVKTIKPAPRIS